MEKVKKKRNIIKDKFKDANEELEALKFRYSMLEDEIEILKNVEEDNLHEINQDKLELKIFNDELYKELIFNKAIL